MNGFYKIEKPKNEEVRKYTNDSKDGKELLKVIESLLNDEIEIPLIINGEEIKTGNTKDCILPHEHSKSIAKYHLAGEKEIKYAIESSLKAQENWANMSFEHRASIFLKLANKLSESHRLLINAATMLTQSKNTYQAEIDSACELIDFLRFNAYFASEIYSRQPISTTSNWNRLSYRPLEGFIYAISPFNFTAIGGNLVCAPALMGNVIVWKPAASAVYSNYIVMKLLKECGLPDGVINFIPGDANEITNICVSDENLAGVHFTGSTDVYSNIWKTIGENINNYRNYPKLVGETGGKDFVFAHPSADILNLVNRLIEGAFGYQGQKCSAASRAYIPKSISKEVLKLLKEKVSNLKVGDIKNFDNQINALIDKKAFEKVKNAIDSAKKDETIEFLIGGEYDDSKGYFIYPTIIISSSKDNIYMTEEFFGPLLTIYIYNDDNIDETLESLDTATKYGLTGAIFARDRQVIIDLEKRLMNSAGNFYINDKPTGAVVGQQPFGGSRSSGTNDKAGSEFNLLRWVSPRTIKENFNEDISDEELLL